MSTKSWHLDRRSFLHGLGVACALPYLEAMGSAQDVATAPKRMCFVYFPNGCSLPGEDVTDYAQWRWFPSGEGTDYRFTEVLASLEPFRERLSVLGGLSHPKARNLLGHLAGDTWLTSGDVRGDRYKNTVSVDQVAAHQLKKHTRYPSLILSGDGGVGYKSRVSTLSFNSEGRPIPSEHRHRAIFERYFSPDGTGTTEERRRSLQRGRKIVDLILEDSKGLQGRLGERDRRKVDEYMESLDSVEEQIKRNEAWLDIPMKEFDSSHLELDVDATVDPKAYIRAHYDLMVLGLETDLTRVMTYMIAREDGMGFGENYPKLALGLNKGHHTISHDLADGHWEEWGKYDRWMAEQFAYFVKRLHEVQDEHGALIDSTMVLYGSCCSTTHNANNYPLVLAGGGNMGLRHGGYHKYGNETPFANTFVGMLNAVGVETESFADSTGTLPEVFG